MIVVRRAHLNDAALACDVLRRSILTSCTKDHRNDDTIVQRWLQNKTPETVASWFAWPAHYSLVAMANDSLVGVAMLSRPGRIVLLHVDPLWRHKGIGAILLQALETKARKSGAAMLRVASTYTARHFYEAHGYEYLSTTSVPYGTALAMTKRLKPDCGVGVGVCGCSTSETEPRA